MTILNITAPFNEIKHKYKMQNATCLALDLSYMYMNTHKATCKHKNINLHDLSRSRIANVPQHLVQTARVCSPLMSCYILHSL